MDHHFPRRAPQGVRAWLRPALAAFLTLAPAAAAAQGGGTIAGRVLDADNGQPIAAAQVTVANTPGGAATGDDGRFTLANIPAGARTVTVRRIGYQQQVRAVTVTAGGTVTLELRLAKATVSLAGVVVTATGEERKKEVGNAISTLGG